jgi:hypothetical protein
MGSSARDVRCVEVHHQATSACRNRLEDFPDDYFYGASLWCSDDERTVAVVCFKNH